MGKGFTYEYPRPAVTADIAVLRLEEVPELLLVQRKDQPFEGHWALPGGFMKMEETLEEAARRELLEETNIKAGELIRFDTYDKPGRDPRGRVVHGGPATVRKPAGGRSPRSAAGARR